jgi:hypothetical protein
MSKHTHRGHCQVCGAQQAVNNETGMLAKHGYTVEHGFFEGECPGSHNLPLEVERTMTDNIIDDLTRQADRIQRQIDNVIIVVPFHYEVKTGPYSKEKRMVNIMEDTLESTFADLGKRVYHVKGQWDDMVEQYRWKLKSQVRFLRAHCEMMTGLIEKRHGADLVTVERIERQSKGFADRTEAKAWLDGLKAEGWTGRIVTDMYKGIREVGRYNAQARRTV